MKFHRCLIAAGAIPLLLVVPVVAEKEVEPASPPTMGSVLEASTASDWMPLDQANTLYMDLPGGQVIIRLAPEFAPQHVANIKMLVEEGYFDGLVIVRSQENYVVQWGDPAEEEADQRPMKKGKRALPAEFDRPIEDSLPVTMLPDGDVYAPQVGFAAGMPVAVDEKSGRMWLTHCYSMMGAGRAESPDSGSGAELYVVIGHSPRHLDLNVTLVGRVVQGMEVLSTLPRGTGGLGFHEDPKQFVPIQSIRLGSDLPEAERSHLEILRTDTPTFEALVESRRNRHESWFANPTGHISLCNVPIPVRPIATE
jgi:peptidylprolyl isomerase